MSQGIDPDRYFSKLRYTKHQAIETQEAAGRLDAGAAYNRNRNRNRNAMIEQGLITSDRSRVSWQSAPLPNDAFAVSAALFNDKALVSRFQAALAAIGPLLQAQPGLLPAHHTGFVSTDNRFYKPIRDAGLATGKLLLP